MLLEKVKTPWASTSQNQSEVDSIMLGVSVNGKNRASIEVDAAASQDVILEAAKAAVEKWIEGKEIVKSIVIPGKLVNLVIKG